MESLDYTPKYCIVGAGSSGLAAAKNLKAHHISFDVIEAEDEVGGNWYYGKPRSSVYRRHRLCDRFQHRVSVYGQKIFELEK